MTPPAQRARRYAQVMVTFRSDTCDKCKNASPISFRTEPEAAWKMVVLNRWRRLCPGCFDAEAGRRALQLRRPGWCELVRPAGAEEAAVERETMNVVGYWFELRANSRSSASSL